MEVTLLSAISTICTSAQQVALDSHRVSRDMSSLHDMICDLKVGSDYSLVALSLEHEFDSGSLSDRLVKWKFTPTDDAHYVLYSESRRHLLRGIIR